jgi:predicted RNase H-like nuclease (RuvC/YqgF family)
MCDDGCGNCARLEAENAALRQEIVRLKILVNVLRHQLEMIRRYAEEVLNRTRAILSRRSGVEPGRWAYARGADGVAERVERLARN